jgi:hypothetical protein
MNVYDAMKNGILDYDYKMSFGRLHEFVAEQDRSKTAWAVLFGSRPPPDDSIWRYAERAGFELILEDRNVANKEKKIDTGIVSAMVKDAHGIGSRRHLRYRHERFPNRGSHLRTAAITERIERSHN